MEQLLVNIGLKFETEKARDYQLFLRGVPVFCSNATLAEVGIKDNDDVVLVSNFKNVLFYHIAQFFI